MGKMSNCTREIKSIVCLSKEELGRDEEEENLGREGHSVIRCTM
jgi:hypothetical protein